MTLKSVEGKIALITGANKGIGLEIARQLGAQGITVLLGVRDENRGREAAEKLQAEHIDARVVQLDVINQNTLNAAASHIESEFGKLDILVNNAGIAIDNAPPSQLDIEVLRHTYDTNFFGVFAVIKAMLPDILVNNAGVMLLGLIDGAETEDWRRMVNINVLGLMYATHAVLPLMKKQGEGHIVNISSVAGRTARVGSGVYNATKWGVGAFSEALRQEVYKDKIRVTIIEPGAVATELTQHVTDPKAKEQIQAFVQSMTPLESEDIAAAIVYAVTQPPRVNVNEILIRPTEQER